MSAMSLSAMLLGSTISLTTLAPSDPDGGSSAVQTEADVPTQVLPPEPTPVQNATPTATGEPQLQHSGGPIQAHNPTYGMQVDAARSEHYNYRARRWKDVIRSSPELIALNRKRRMMIPGIVLTSVGSSFLVLSTAISIDIGPPETATGILFRWIAPGAILATGLPLLIVGAKARAQLDEKRVQLMATPMFSRGQAGAMLVGRF